MQAGGCCWLFVHDNRWSVLLMSVAVKIVAINQLVCIATPLRLLSVLHTFSRRGVLGNACEQVARCSCWVSVATSFWRDSIGKNTTLLYTCCRCMKTCTPSDVSGWCLQCAIASLYFRYWTLKRIHPYLSCIMHTLTSSYCWTLYYTTAGLLLTLNCVPYNAL